MNRDRIEYCIELMRGADRLNMLWYQSGDEVDTLEEFHQCGNTACFAGYVALSPEFRAEGGSIDFGSPVWEGEEGASAIAQWLGISYALAERFVYGHDDFYPVPFGDVKPQHVIEKLQAILDGELA